MSKILYRSLTFGFLTMSFQSSFVFADTSAPRFPEGLDVSKWQCKYCVFPKGLEGEIELGVGIPSDSSYKFGEYNGLEEDDPYAVFNASLSYRGDNALFYNLTIQDLGLETRELTLETGKQGKYELSFAYDKLTHHLSDAATPFAFSDSSHLVLPTDWTAIATTQEMDEELSSVEIKTEREQIKVSALFIPARSWETYLNVKHEIKEGNKLTGGAFYFNSAQLIEPIDYVTDEIELAATYTLKKWQSRIAYYGSKFTNNTNGLNWQNPFHPIVDGADMGQLALPQDNQAHHFSAVTGYQWGKTRLDGSLSVGQLSQDATDIAATLNSEIDPLTNTANISTKANTLNGHFRVNSVINRKFQLKASYRQNERKNKTESHTYAWVSSDSFVNAPRRNLPYSFKTQLSDIEGIYRVTSKIKLRGGYNHEEKQRSNQEVEKSVEQSYWAKLRFRLSNIADLQVKTVQSERDSENYSIVSDITPEQNPLLRKYNLADRDRSLNKVSANFFINERITIDLSYQDIENEYSNSLIGLTESDEQSYGIDFSMLVTDSLHLHTYVNQETIESDQAGSHDFSLPNWFLTNEDTIDTYGANIEYRFWDEKVKLNLNYYESHSVGKTLIDVYTGTENFPEFSTDLSSLTLSLDYKLSDSMSVKLKYLYEELEAEDWTRDNLTPDTLNNVLSAGYVSPDYDLSVTAISFSYRF